MKTVLANTSKSVATLWVSYALSAAVVHVGGAPTAAAAGAAVGTGSLMASATVRPVIDAALARRIRSIP